MQWHPRQWLAAGLATAAALLGCASYFKPRPYDMIGWILAIGCGVAAIMIYGRYWIEFMDYDMKRDRLNPAEVKAQVAAARKSLRRAQKFQAKQDRIHGRIKD